MKLPTFLTHWHAPLEKVALVVSIFLRAVYRVWATSSVWATAAVELDRYVFAECIYSDTEGTGMLQNGYQI